ncbi:MAG: SPOR domain-containing protein [Porticoccaceae bacterium]|nr:SPOR domain-containing protein [Porticoccaceae bacterium]
MQCKRSAIVAFLALVTSLCCLAENPGFDDGKAAYDQHNYPLAWNLWRQAAEDQHPGDARVYFHLGVLYDQGLGVVKDDTAAFAWYEKAALLGHSIASFNLGNAYKHGRGVGKNEQLASHWWQKAADAGVANAQFNLAIQYYSGLGVARNNDKAVAYFNLAEQNGHERARQLIASNKIPRLKAEPLSPRGQHQPQSLGTDSTPTIAAQQAPEPLKPSAQLTAPPRKSPGREGPSSWLNEQNPQHFSIQLAVTENDQGIASFIARHNLEGQVETAVIVRQGKQFHYVLMGAFADRAAAVDHILAMPVTLRQLKPWPRRFAELQGLADSGQ